MPIRPAFTYDSKCWSLTAEDDYSLQIFEVRILNTGILRWLVHLCKMQKQNPCKKLTFHKPEGTRGVDRPVIRWQDSVEYLKIMGIGNLR